MERRSRIRVRPMRAGQLVSENFCEELGSRMVILGINAYHGDASAALVADGDLVAAAEEERFNRIKHAAGFPSHAIRYCLDQAGVKPGEIAIVALARDPRVRLLRRALYAARMPRLALERLGVLKKFAGVRAELASVLGVGSEGLTATPR